jgi:hypothetical protein
LTKAIFNEILLPLLDGGDAILLFLLVGMRGYASHFSITSLFLARFWLSGLFILYANTLAHANKTPVPC